MFDGVLRIESTCLRLSLDNVLHRQLCAVHTLIVRQCELILRRSRQGIFLIIISEHMAFSHLDILKRRNLFRYLKSDQEATQSDKRTWCSVEGAMDCLRSHLREYLRTKLAVSVCVSC